jgi:hypothetical protein
MSAFIDIIVVLILGKLIGVIGSGAIMRLPKTITDKTEIKM